MASAADLKRDACNAIDAMGGDLIEISHAIHANPELAFHEFAAAERLSAVVEAAGLPIQREAYGLETGYVSAFGAKGAEIAILSEYDALPDIGHACGHNIIAVTGLGAALALGKLGGQFARASALSRHAGGRERRRQGIDGPARRVRWRRCGDDGASGRRRSRRHAVHLRIASDGDLSWPQRARVGHAPARDQCARCARHRLSSHCAIAPAHPPDRAHPRHHHQGRRRAEHRARSRRGILLRPRTEDGRAHRAEEACRGVLSGRRAGDRR